MFALGKRHFPNRALSLSLLVKGVRCVVLCAAPQALSDSCLESDREDHHSQGHWELLYSWRLLSGSHACLGHCECKMYVNALARLKIMLTSEANMEHL